MNRLIPLLSSFFYIFFIFYNWKVMNDVREPVRCLAAQIIGTMSAVSQTFLEQTLDKKLMSNMRMKKSSHERQVRSG